MPIWIDYVYSCDVSEFLDKIGLQFTRVQFKDIQPGIKDSFVMGRISEAFPIANHPVKGSFRKIEIEEAEDTQNGNLRLVIFLYDIFAVDINFSKKDLIAVANMQILPLPRNEAQEVDKHPYYLALKRIEEEPSLWVMTCSFPQDKKNSLVYTYNKIIELRPSKKYNFYGIVKEVSETKKTSGTDYLKKITVVDQSSYKHPDLRNFKVHIFDKDETKIPQISQGDVVRCHRVQVENFCNSLQGTTHSGAYVLVWSNNGKSSILPKSTSHDYTFTVNDKEEVQKLRKWFNDNSDAILSSGPIADPVNPNFPPSKNAPKTVIGQSDLPSILNHTNLSQVRLGMYYNFLCQVLGVCIVDKSHVVLTIWDCTKISGFVYQGQVPYILQYCEEQMLPEIKNYMVNVSVFDEHCELASKIEPGSFVWLRNVRVCLDTKNKSHCVRFYMHKGYYFNRGITVLQEMPDSFRKKLEIIYEEMLDKRRIWKNVNLDSSIEITEQPLVHALKSIDLNQETNKLEPSAKKKKIDQQSQNKEFSMLNPLTVIIGHHHIKPVTVADVLKHSVPYKFRLLVKVKDYQPLLRKKPFSLIYYHCTDCGFMKPFDDQKKNINVSQICPRCTESSSDLFSKDFQTIETVHLQPIIILHLTLYDKTGTLPVLLCKEHANFENFETKETFFRKISAQKYLQDEAAREAVQQSLEEICPSKKCNSCVESEHQNLDLCIFSYKTSSGVKYQIFDTVINHTPTSQN